MAVKQKMGSVAFRTMQRANRDGSVPFEVNIKLLKDGLGRAMRSRFGSQLLTLNTSISSSSKAYLGWKIEEQFWFAVCQYYGLRRISRNINSALEIFDSISLSKPENAHVSSTFLRNLTFHYFSTLIVRLHIIDGSFGTGARAKQARREKLLQTLPGPACKYNGIPYGMMGVFYQQLADLFENCVRDFSGKAKSYVNAYENISIIFKIKIKHHNIDIARNFHVNSAHYFNPNSYLWLSRNIYTNAKNLFGLVDHPREMPWLKGLLNLEHYSLRFPFLIPATFQPLLTFLQEYNELTKCINTIRSKIENNDATYRDVSFILAYQSARYGFPEAVKVVLQFCIIYTVSADESDNSETLNKYEQLASHYIDLSKDSCDLPDNVEIDCYSDNFTSFLVGREYESVCKKFSSNDESHYDYSGFSKEQPKADFVFNGCRATCEATAINYFRKLAFAEYQPAIDRLETFYPGEYAEMKSRAENPSRSNRFL